MPASEEATFLPKVLVVEDTLMIAETLVDLLEDFGCRIVGPASRLMLGLDLACRETLDCALLDVNLAGEYCFPIATVLTERGIPFAFLTGYGDAEIDAEFRHVPRLTKPFKINELTNLLVRHFGLQLREPALAAGRPR